MHLVTPRGVAAALSRPLSSSLALDSEATNVLETRGQARALGQHPHDAQDLRLLDREAHLHRVEHRQAHSGRLGQIGQAHLAELAKAAHITVAA